MLQLLQVGDRIDKYRIDQCIGEGGMGEVYLVTHTFLNIQRALKILRLDLIEDDPTFRDRFVREARIAARFQHPNSIGVVDVETKSDSGFLYLVMEYVDGQSLHQYLPNGPFPEKEMLRICREVANVLDAAWREMQLVHRDIKPGNIMLSKEGDVKLADLGIAKSAGSDMTLALTLAGTMIGTPEYASPEQCRDSSHVDTRADIYSLGATMYEMLTCTRPFHGTNAFDTVVKVLQEPLPPLRDRNTEISAETAALVERMMSKDPADRPQTLRELVEIVDGMLANKANALTENVAEEKKAAPVQQQVLDSAKKRKKALKLLWVMIFLNLIMGGLVLYDFLAFRHSLFLIRQEHSEKINSLNAQYEKKRQIALKQQNRPGIIVDFQGRNLLHYKAEGATIHYVVPMGITSISSYAFENADNLQQVFCPDSVQHISRNAFYGCRNLKSVSVANRCYVVSGALPANVRLIRRSEWGAK